jgi:hypothetical protein
MSDIASRTCGILLIGGAILLAISISIISSRPVMNRSFAATESLLAFLAGLLLIISLPAMYSLQSAASGLPGLIGYVSLQAGMLFLVAIAAPRLLFPSFNEPLGESVAAFLLGIALVLGLFATGIAVLQAGVFPRATGFLILAATAGFFFTFFIAEFLPPIAGQVGSAIFAVLLGAAFAWIGLSLAMGTTTAA